jgi:hypothetical protein
VQGTYLYRYLSFSPPSTSGFGTIASALPGSPPVFADRNWFYAGAPYEHVGNIYDVTEMYWLSDAGDWPSLIYSLQAMSGNGGGGGGDTPSTQNYKTFTAAFAAVFGGG